MNFKTTFALLALLAMVGAYFVFIEMNRPAGSDTAADSARRSQRQPGSLLFDEGALKVEDVTAMTITRGNEKARLVRQNGEWTQVEPVHFPLDGYKPDQVIQQAAELHFVKELTPGDPDTPSLGDMRLDPARVIVEFETASGKHTLKLGRTVAGSRGYVMLNDDPHVYVVDDTVHESLLDQKIASWRKRSLNVPRIGSLEAITLARSAESASLVKHDGRWFLDEAHTQRASEEAVSKLTDALSGLYISNFESDAADKLAMYGMEHPRLVVTLRQAAVETPAASENSEAEAEKTEEAAEPKAATEPPVTLRIGAPADLKEDTFYATWSVGDEVSPVVFTINKGTVESLSKGPNDLRDPRIVLSRPADVIDFTAQRTGGDTLRVLKENGAWAFGDPKPAFNIDSESVGLLLEKLATARAESYAPGFAPTGEPAAVISLAVGGENPERVSLYRPAGEPQLHWVALRDGENVGYLVPKVQLDDVFLPALALRDKTILDVKADDLTAVTLTQPGGVTLKFAKLSVAPSETAAEVIPAVWTLEGAASFEREAFDAALAKLSPLRAENWVTDAGASHVPDLTLTIETAEGSPRTLSVDTTTRRASLSEIDAKFVVPQSLVDALKAELRDRRALGLTREQITGVDIAGPEKQVAYRKNAEGVYTDAEGGRVSQSLAGGVFDALATLRVERYLPTAGRIPDDRAVKLTITPTEGEPRELVLHRDEDLARLDGRWFTLGQATRDKLFAPLTAPETVELDTPEADMMK